MLQKDDSEAFVATSTLAVTPVLSEPAGRATQEPKRISRVRGAENAACLLQHTTHVHRQYEWVMGEPVNEMLKIIWHFVIRIVTMLLQAVLSDRIVILNIF